MPNEIIRISPVNDIGLRLNGSPGENLQKFYIYPECGSVQVWVETRGQMDAMQYLSPEEAMAFAKAFERCAIQAFKERA